METIRIFTNDVAGGWKANDVDNFLGGSEECVVLLAEALFRAGFKVYVYHTYPEGFMGVYDRMGVIYNKREEVKVEKGDILISFKDTLPWRGDEQGAGLKIHWSSDVEMLWDDSNVDYIVNLTPYHNTQNIGFSPEKKVVIPHGVESLYFDGFHYGKKDVDSMLYCSSPDRGLLTLLNDWVVIKQHYPLLKLRITYGFKNLSLMSGRALEIQRAVRELVEQQDITLLGQLTKEQMIEEYRKSLYWVLPLNRPASELFCLNAVKSRLCGMFPVVNKVGALSDTVGDYIPYKAFRDGNDSMVHEAAYFDSLDWDSVVKNYWIPLFERKPVR